MLWADNHSPAVGFLTEQALLDQLKNAPAGTAMRVLLEPILHPPIGRMLAVLVLDPVLRSASAIGAISPLTHHALKAHVARGPEQVGTNLALLERGDEDAVGAAAQESRQVGLAQA